jgi:Cupin
MDALSDVLRVIRLKGGVFLHAEFTAPWCILSQVNPGDCGSLLEGADHLVLYHYVVEGRLAAQIPNAKPIAIEAGEVVVFPHNCWEATSTYRRCRRDRWFAPSPGAACGRSAMAAAASEHASCAASWAATD